MITFLVGLLILVVGYIFYSNYVEKQFEVSKDLTPAVEINDKQDFMPLSRKKNMLIHLLNIAGLGPILGAIQGALFGPIAFIMIPTGCILMGCVHDYFSGMISLKNKGAQITELIKIYLGKNSYKFFILLVSIMLLILSSVFVFTSGDIIAERFFHQTDFSLANPLVITIYSLVTLYFVLAALFPIDKIIGKFYPIFGIMLVLGTILILLGFFTNGVSLYELDFAKVNQHPKLVHIIPIFFMTVSCGLLSGFHSTQSTIVSRTLKEEKDGKKVFFMMMAVESFIAMVWAAAAMHIYNQHLIDTSLYGSVNVINRITDVFIHPYLVFIVAITVVILPITSGGTALRGLRMIIAEAFGMEQAGMKNRLLIILPLTALLIGVIFWAKINPDSFSSIWKYFNFTNQMIAVPTFLYSTVYLFKKGKNYFITLIPAMFYTFITSFFIMNADIGFGLDYNFSKIVSIVITLLMTLLFVKKMLLSKD